MKQHKWHKEIKAWADGAEIEMWYGDRWEQVYHAPDWFEHEVYRIKQQAIPSFKAPTDPTGIKEPQYLYVSYHPQNSSIRLLDYVDKNSYYIGKIKLEDTE